MNAHDYFCVLVLFNTQYKTSQKPISWSYCMIEQNSVSLFLFCSILILIGIGIIQGCLKVGTVCLLVSVPGGAFVCFHRFLQLKSTLG